MNLLITSFRYVTKRGQGKSITFYRYLGAPHGHVHPGRPAKGRVKRPLQVQVTKVWRSGDEPSLYKGHPIDPFLKRFLAEHAHPDNMEVYFAEESIYDHARTAHDAASPVGLGMGR